MMGLVQWTKGKLSELAGEDVPVKRSDSLEARARGRIAVPSFDLFESESEIRLVIDLPGATPANTHLTWDDVDTLTVHVEREAVDRGTPWLSEYDESDWFRAITVSPEVDGPRVSSTVRNGVVTIRLPKRRTIGSRAIPVFAA
jgi:HSP20 family molecular chaperone IbpA